MSGPLRYGLTTLIWIQCEQQGKGLVINNGGGGGVSGPLRYDLTTVMWIQCEQQGKGLVINNGEGRCERTPPVRPDHRYVDTV